VFWRAGIFFCRGNFELQCSAGDQSPASTLKSAQADFPIQPSSDGFRLLGRGFIPCCGMKAVKVILEGVLEGRDFLLKKK
jgi:hypothetical protein